MAKITSWEIHTCKILGVPNMSCMLSCDGNIIGDPLTHEDAQTVYKWLTSVTQHEIDLIEDDRQRAKLSHRENDEDGGW